VVKAVLANLTFQPSTGENMPNHFPVTSPFPAGKWDGTSWGKMGGKTGQDENRLFLFPHLDIGYGVLDIGH
jgi:hypothetical protein